MLASRKTVVWLFFALERVLAAQIPLPSGSSWGFDSNFGHDFWHESAASDDLAQWDLDGPPAMNATGNLVFETANSLLQHWANTRYRLGRSLKTEELDHKSK
jgi:hypothetical protein